MAGAAWLIVQGRFDDLGDARPIVVRLSTPSGSNLPDGADALPANTMTPQQDRATLNPQHLGDPRRGLPLAGQESNPTTQDDLLRGGASSHPLFKAADLVFVEAERWELASPYLRDTTLGGVSYRRGVWAEWLIRPPRSRPGRVFLDPHAP
jgi:hypothetical protein